MNFAQLAAFREVMLTGSVSAASRNLNRTQPAVSAALASLENDLGLKLFERRGGRLHAVPEAHYLMSEATEILTRVENSKRTLTNLRDLQHGSIRVVSMPGPSVFLLPDLVRRFVESRPEVDVSLLARSSFQVFQLVSVQQFDLGLADLMPDGFQPSPLIDQEAFKFRCVCAMAADSPLAGKREISAADLNGHPMAALRREHPTNQHTRQAFAAAGAEFYQRFEMQYFIPMFNVIEHGLACAIVDPMSAESYRIYQSEKAKVVFKPFAPVVYHDAALITPAHRPASRLALEFNAAVRKRLKAIECA
jgi:DNA-binding transcriptional LysR family regulator